MGSIKNIITGSVITFEHSSGLENIEIMYYKYNIVLFFYTLRQTSKNYVYFLQTNKQKLAVDRYPHPPTDNQVVVPLSIPFHNYLSRRVEILSKCTNKLS